MDPRLNFVRAGACVYALLGFRVFSLFFAFPFFLSFFVFLQQWLTFYWASFQLKN